MLPAVAEGPSISCVLHSLLRPSLARETPLRTRACVLDSHSNQNDPQRVPSSSSPSSRPKEAHSLPSTSHSPRRWHANVATQTWLLRRAASSRDRGIGRRRFAVRASQLRRSCTDTPLPRGAFPPSISSPRPPPSAPVSLQVPRPKPASPCASSSLLGSCDHRLAVLFRHAAHRQRTPTRARCSPIAPFCNQEGRGQGVRLLAPARTWTYVSYPSSLCTAFRRLPGRVGSPSPLHPMHAGTRELGSAS